MPICTHAENRIGHYISFSITIHLVALRKELSLSGKLTISNRLSREKTSWADQTLHHHPVLQEHASDVGIEDSNSGSLACMGSTLPQ